MRLRTDYMHKLHLDQSYMTTNAGSGGAMGGIAGAGSGPPAHPRFLLPLEREGSSDPLRIEKPGSGNIRLRLEPTINISDQVRVMAQVDLLDNTILGSTPTVSSGQTWRRPRTVRAPRSPESANAVTHPRQAGLARGGQRVRHPCALRRHARQFGRHGLQQRQLSYCDGESNVDRIIGLTQLYGHQVALAWDFGLAGHYGGIYLRDPGDLSRCLILPARRRPAADVSDCQGGRRGSLQREGRQGESMLQFTPSRAFTGSRARKIDQLSPNAQNQINEGRTRVPKELLD